MGKIHNLVACFGLITLLALGSFYAAPKIQQDIQIRAEQDLLRTSWVKVHVNGRTVHLSGKAPAGARAYVKRRLKGVAGVGRIVNHGTN